MDDKTREEIIKEQERLIKIQEKVHDKLMKISGVEGTAVGAKIVDGKITKELVIKVYVLKKKKQENLRESDLIPPIISGIKTDVLEIGENRLEGDEKKYRPLCGGIQINTGHYEEEINGNIITKKLGIGTLGCFAKDNLDNSIVLLSNFHVLLELGSKIGGSIGQPNGPCDTCCCTCCEIAKNVRGIMDNEVDCAIAKLTDEYKFNYQNEILEIGPIFGTADAVMFERVRKRGKTTGLTIGTVTSINKNLPIAGLNYIGQIEITPEPPLTRFSAGGDSGSVYVNEFNQVIGLHFSGNGFLAHGNQIDNVLAKLNISIPSEGTLLSIPIKATLNNPTKNIDKIIALIKSLEFGNKFIDLAETHRIEILKLINKNREVKLAWNRYKGPLFIAHIMEKSKDVNYEFPDKIDGISAQQLLIKMSDVLENNGSDLLKNDIENYSINILQLLHKIIKNQCSTLIS